VNREKKILLEKLFSLFESRPSLLIVIHPDPDSIASAMAFRRLLLRKASKIQISYDEASKRLQNQAMIRLLKVPMTSIHQTRLSDFELIAVLDGQWNHFPALLDHKVNICIDHHPIAVEHPYQFADIRPHIGATSTILAEYLQLAKIQPSQPLATALCYGIKTDTDAFTRNMQKEDALAFAWLFPQADFYLFKSIDQVEMSARELEYFRIALDLLKIKRKTAFIHIGATPNPDILVMIADFLIKVREIEMAIVSGFEADRLVVIFRNRNPRIDIGKLAKKAFEPPGIAGGHKYSARAEIPNHLLPQGLEHSVGEKINRWLEQRLKSARAKS